MKSFKEYVRVLNIAVECHKANNELLVANGQEPQPEWKDLSQDQKWVGIKSVERIMSNPKITSEDIHIEWMNNKKKQGWVYGEVKDEDKKTHPCLVDYKDLSDLDKMKDSIFIDTVLKYMGEEGLVSNRVAEEA